MPSRSSREAASRSAARRRARQLERGEIDAPAQESAGDAARREEQPARRGFLSSLFPPAPPLPNRPDPLAGFTYTGPLRSVASWFYLLAGHPRAWLLPAIPWAMAQTLILLSPPEAGLLQTVCVLASVSSVMVAGWIGWPKPWLFGFTTSFVGTLLQGIFLALLVRPLGGDATPIGSFVGVMLLQLSQGQWLLSAFVGWYAGYFRRRLASQPRRETTRRARR